MLLVSLEVCQIYVVQAWLDAYFPLKISVFFELYILYINAWKYVLSILKLQCIRHMLLRWRFRHYFYSLEEQSSKVLSDFWGATKDQISCFGEHTLKLGLSRVGQRSTNIFFSNLAITEVEGSNWSFCFWLLVPFGHCCRMYSSYLMPFKQCYWRGTNAYPPNKLLENRSKSTNWDILILGLRISFLLRAIVDILDIVICQMVYWMWSQIQKLSQEGT